VVVEAPSGGFDVGKFSLSGELARLQIEAKKGAQRCQARFSGNARHTNAIWKGSTRCAGKKKEVLVKARVIARSLGWNMKIGDVEIRVTEKSDVQYCRRPC
jgi:hypothetical protein